MARSVDAIYITNWQETGSNVPIPHTHGGPVAAQCSWGAVQWFNSRRSDIRSYDGNLSMRQAEKSASWMFVPGITADAEPIFGRWQPVRMPWIYRDDDDEVLVILG